MIKEEIMNKIQQEKLRLYNDFIDLVIEAQKKGYTQEKIANVIWAKQYRVSLYLKWNKPRLMNTQKYVKALSKELWKEFIW